MKRILCLALLALTLGGCTKMDKNPLIGTKWETTGFTMIDILAGYKYHVYDFHSEDKVNSYWLDRNGKVGASDGECSYYIEEPYVFITHDEDDVRKFEMTDNITMVSTTNSSIKYYKQ